ncbi:MAG: hypothetical protein DMG62_03330 [Acidobacteria bacterium]|nr:MAG: hypothetical protein DMG63_07290 [Acidobacteriota bacterium]PYY24336.1 MAG: hypothetical protein DMG62_03330 [Acidobacteriota bacterium]
MSRTGELSNASNPHTVQHGQKYALVVGQKVYTLQGHEDDLNRMAGQRATVKGSVSRDTVTVSSVTAAKRWATT